MSSAVEIAIRVAEERRAAEEFDRMAREARKAEHHAKLHVLLEAIDIALRDFCCIPGFTRIGAILYKKNVAIAQLCVRFCKERGHSIEWQVVPDCKQVCYTVEEFNQQFGRAMARYL